MSENKRVPLIGRLALQLKMIDTEQLSSALQAHAAGGGGGTLGEVLIREGFLTPAQLHKLDRVQRDVIAKHRAKQAAKQTSQPPVAAPPQRPDQPATAAEPPDVPQRPEPIDLDASPEPIDLDASPEPIDLDSSPEPVDLDASPEPVDLDASPEPAAASAPAGPDFAADPTAFDGRALELDTTDSAPLELDTSPASQAAPPGSVPIELDSAPEPMAATASEAPDFAADPTAFDGRALQLDTADSEPIALETSPEPEARESQPEPVALAPSPEPVALETSPEPVAVETSPEPVALESEPEPVALPTCPEPFTPAAAHPAPAGAPEQKASPAPVAVEADSAGPSLDLSVWASTDADRERLHALLRSAVEAGASDVHIHSGAALQLRVHGRLASTGAAPLDPSQIEGMIFSALSDEERLVLAREGELDLCYVVPDVGRFRTNIYRQQRGFDAVMRTIPNQPPSLAELGLPADLAKYTQYHQGMVLITGPAGCGKSSTMAALVNLINEEREEHVLCVEDPIEYVHPSKKCFVNQRHAGRDTRSFARALRGALREDPDVIVIGELRDLETISLAMTAAETGHLVLATLHTNNAVRTINRMIGAFPSNQQGQVRTMLSESLRAVISQRLVPRMDETGRVAALEVLVINKAIANLIRDEKTIQIRSAIQTGANQGMYLLEQSLNELVKSSTIDKDVALALAEEKKLITG